MSEPVYLALSALAGVALGALFTGGLWWTVRKALQSPAPAAWFLGSFVLRSAAVVAGFYFVGQQRWPRMGACLAGFVLGRFILTRVIRRPPCPSAPLGKEVRDASQPG